VSRGVGVQRDPANGVAAAAATNGAAAARPGNHAFRPALAESWARKAWWRRLTQDSLRSFTGKDLVWPACPPARKIDCSVRVTHVPGPFEGRERRRSRLTSHR
jgi:hypothetical protein